MKVAKSKIEDLVLLLKPGKGCTQRLIICDKDDHFVYVDVTSVYHLYRMLHPLILEYKAWQAEEKALCAR